MIVQLTPDQIGEYWERVESAILLSNPEASASYIGKTLEAAVAGKVQVWIIFRERKLLGVLVSGFASDPVGVRMLFTTALQGFGLSKSDFIDIIDTLRLYAKEHRCYSVTTIVERKGLKRVLYKLGFVDNGNFISLEN